MTLAVLGDVADARGFRLAGVESRVCRTRDQVARATAALADGVGVVLVSASVYRLAPSEIDALRDRPRWPIVVMLPDTGQERERSA
jgi:vacuolar-type H+-ATPase subunit F/Vma7